MNKFTYGVTTQRPEPAGKITYEPYIPTLGDKIKQALQYVLPAVAIIWLLIFAPAVLGVFIGCFLGVTLAAWLCE